jgi:uncharacterized protein with von Willebrand factor type A (vWA) domain
VRAVADPIPPVPGVPGPDTAVGFVRVLRAAGLPVSVHHSQRFVDGLGVVGWADAGSVYWTARATLGIRPEAVPTFDAAFTAFFGARTGTPVVVEAPPTEVVLALDTAADPDTVEESDGAPVGAPVLTVRWSAAETLRERDFATYSAAEHDEVRRLLADTRLAAALRRSRRSRPRRNAARRPDVRRTVRAALRTGGEPIARPGRVPAARPRRLVVLCDVSGSMEPYTRVLVRFLHTAVVGPGSVEAFGFGTRLTRVTRDLANRDPDVAIAAAARRVTDWSGGTRLGAVLREFNDTWGLRGMARGADVVVISDGWDRGDPAMLGEQMARLARVTHRIIWVNPLKASPGYAPLAGGMAAALPYVDEFVEGHSLGSLEELVRVLEEATA